MRSDQNREMLQIKVGLFLITGIALAMFAVFLLGSRAGFLKTHYMLYAYFDDITGLSVGSQVKLAGVGIGFVESIEFEEPEVRFAPADNEIISWEGDLPPENETTPIDSGGNEIRDTGVKVKVALNLDPKYQNRIRADSVASVTTQGLLGDGIIFISVGTPKSKRLEHGDRILKIRNPSGLAQLQRKGEKIINSAEGLLVGAETLVSNLNAVLDEVKEGDGFAHEIIYGNEATRVLQKANKMMDSLDVTAKNFASISNKIDDGKGTIGKFVNDAGVYNDLKTLLGKANRNKLVRSVIRYTLATREEQQSK